VPISLARELAPGLPVVAVVLSPPIEQWHSPIKPRLLSTLPFLGNYISRHRLARALDIFMRSVDIGGARLTEQILELEKPEVIIRPPVPHIGLLDPVDVHEVVHLGEIGAEAALPQLFRVVSWRGRLSARVSRMAYSRRNCRHVYGA
jgi:NTE family protein